MSALTKGPLVLSYRAPGSQMRPAFPVQAAADDGNIVALLSERGQQIVSGLLRGQRQRDELLAAAVAIINQHNPRSEAGDKLRAAIAKVQE